MNQGFLSDTEANSSSSSSNQQLLKRLDTAESLTSNDDSSTTITSSTGSGNGSMSNNSNNKKNEDSFPSYEKNIPKRVTLAWKALTIRAEIRTFTQRVIATVKRQKRHYETILQNVRGIVEPGEMLALMGPRFVVFLLLFYIFFLVFMISKFMFGSLFMFSCNLT